MKTNPNDSAYASNQILNDVGISPHPGLTKLEYFTAAALTGALAGGHNILNFYTNADLAVEAAKTTIKRLNEEGEL